MATAVKEKRQDAEDQFKDAWSEFHRKKRIKRSIAAERRNDPPPLESTAVEVTPVLTLDEGGVVLHGASADDIRAVLCRLPESARHGLAEIRLSLGVAEQEEHAKQETDAAFRDPVLGRPGGTLIPGVYTGHVLGSFSRRSGVISIYAYVVDTDATTMPKDAMRVYLRLTALTTLIHEVAHHHDMAMRVRRGRWLSDKEENAEAYAEKMTRQWTAEILPRYLQETYSNEVKSLLDWLDSMTGIRLRLEFFLDQSETFLPIAYLFRRWLEELAKSPTQSESRISFAQWIVYADRYAESLGIVDQLLANRGDWPEALILRAELLNYLRRFDDAYEQAERILKNEPDCVAALQIKSAVFEERKDWHNLLSNSDESIKFAERPSDKRRALMFRAVALCALQRDEEFEQTFAILCDSGLQAPIQEVRARIFRRVTRQQHARA